MPDKVFVDTAAWIALLNSRDAYHSSARQVMDQSLQIVPISRPLWLEGWALYKQRADKEWGLTDCTSFVVMTQEQVTQAFTSDRHFEQAGFVNLL